VIQSILFFSLGFLCAGFLALMVAPAIWRRAVLLTRKRIEASVPLSLSEIQADKDRMRAEFAMSTRRLEMSMKQFREKAAAQVIEINRNREELKRLATDRVDKSQALTELEGRSSELRAELRQREDQLQRLADKLAEADHVLEQRAFEVEKLGRMYEDATLSSSNKQIELVVRETEVERLHGDVTMLRDQRKDAERRMRDLVNENKALRDSIKAEKKKSADLEKKVDRMLTTLTDRDEKLDRREKELARLRDAIKGGSEQEHELNGQLVDAQQEKVKLEVDLADLTLQMSTLLSGAKGADIEKAIGKLQEDRERLEKRLTSLTRENKKLRADLEAFERSKTDDWGDERRENALLREQINDLAAEVVTLTAALDGPQSPIQQAIALAADEPDAQPSPENIKSLADRVRALQKAASATV
jgi:chromosome segregation ATPase